MALKDMQINTQIIPPPDTMLAKAPSGRDVHTTKPFVPPSLEADILTRMRAPLDIEDSAKSEIDDGSSSEEDEHQSNFPGAFPRKPGADILENSYY